MNENGTENTLMDKVNPGEDGREDPLVDGEFEVDLSDILLDDDDSDYHSEEESVQADAPAGSTDKEEEAAENKKEATGGDSTETSEHSEQQKQANPDVFVLKLNHETKEVSREEALALAQQGLDYERVRNQRDEFDRQRKELQKFRDANADVVDFLKELADDTGMTPEQVMDEIRSNQYVRKGMSQEAAKERVAREKAERRLNAATQHRRQQEQEKQAADDERRRRDEDIQAFFQSFPGVEPKDIPQEVWAAVTQGQRLVSAYREWKTSRDIAEAKAENQRLKAELEAAKKNNQNRQKTVGTQKTVGAEQTRDAFLDALLAND